MQNELRAPRDGRRRAGRRSGRGRRSISATSSWSSRDRATRSGARALAARRPGPRRSARRPERRERFATSSDIEIADLYTAGRPRGARLRSGPRPRAAGRVPVHPRRPADDVPLPVLDDAPVRRLRHGRGDEPALPLPARAGPDRPVGRVRPADPDGLRLGRARGGGRGRPGRRPDQLARRHGDPPRRPAARRGEHVDDDQLDGGDPARPLRRRGREAGRRPRPDLGDDPERHPQGVHRPRHVDLPAAAVDAPRDRHLRVLRRRSCPAGTRSRSPATTCARPGATAAQELAFTLADAIAYCEAAVARGLPIDDFAGRLSFFFAAWSELFEEVAKFRAARRMWARIVRDRFGATSERSMMCRFHVQTAGSSLTAQSIDNNVVRTTDPGAVGRPRRRPEPPHERPRRGARPADRGERPAGAPDPADPRPRERRHRDAGPARRLVLRREPDDPARGGGPGLSRRDRGDGRHARRDRGRLPAAPDPGVGVPGPAGDRAGRPGRRRRQQVPRRRRAQRRRRRSSGSTRRASGARSSASAGSGRSAIRPPGRRSLRPARGARPGRGEPHAARSSRRSGPTRRSARSATGSGRPGASTAS